MNVSAISQWVAALTVEQLQLISIGSGDQYPGRMRIGRYNPADGLSQRVYACLRRDKAETGSVVCLLFHTTDIASEVIQLTQDSALWEQVTWYPAIDIAAGGPRYHNAVLLETHRLHHQACDDYKNHVRWQAHN